MKFFRHFLSLSYLLTFSVSFVFGQRKNILFESTAEETTAITRWDAKGSCCPYSIQKTSSVRRFGSYSLRFELNKSDSSVAFGKRAELNRFSLDTYPLERWIGFSIYIPNSTDFITDQKFLSDIFFQWHDRGSIGETEMKSPLDISIDADRWIATLRSAPNKNSTNSDIKEGIKDIGKVTKGVWTDFVIHVKFTHLANGFLQIWTNGTSVYEYTGPIGYNHAIAPFLKMGLYKWPWNDENLSCCGATNSKKRVIYLDEIRIGNELATYADVYPTQTSTLNGVINIEGRPSAPSNLLKIPLQVQLYKCPTPTLFATYNVYTNQYGQFTVTGIPSGSYTIAVKGNQTLKKTNPIQFLQPGNNTINFGELRTGDANNNNIVDSVDLKLLSINNNKALSDPGYDSRADLDGDSIISNNDFSLLLNNFGSSGQPVSCNCVLPNPVITATSCNGENAKLRLSAAPGRGPYNLAINQKWYNNLNIGDSIDSFLFPQYSLWPNNTVPILPSNNDSTSIEVGIKFRTTKSGFIKGIRFYNGNNNSGIYTGNLYDYKTGTLKGRATFTNVSKNGWQTVLFATPVYIEANNTYIASCYSSAGNYASNNNYYFSDSGRTSGPVTALRDGVDGTNGVYQHGGGMPTRSHRSSNYWVDIQFSPESDTLLLTNFENADGCKNSGALQKIIVKSTNCSTTSLKTTNESQQSTTPKTQFVEADNFVTTNAQKPGLGLEQNFPNPSFDFTTIKFSLDKADRINLSLFDMNGRLIKVLANGYKDPGLHSVNLNVTTFSKGVYYYRLQTSDSSIAKKMSTY